MEVNEGYIGWLSSFTKNVIEVNNNIFVIFRPKKSKQILLLENESLFNIVM